MADDSYLSIAAIADDEFIAARMNACTTQQQHLDTIVIDAKWGDDATAALSWVANYRYLWASSPGWGAAWASALAAHADDSTYEPGQDEAVITDEMILSTVQTLAAPPTEPAVTRIDSINPVEGPAAGGTDLTLTGVGLTDISNVTVGTGDATALDVVDDTTITCQTPPGADGDTVDVTATGGAGGDATLPGAYTYTA